MLSSAKLTEPKDVAWVLAYYASAPSPAKPRQAVGRSPLINHPNQRCHSEASAPCGPKDLWIRRQRNDARRMHGSFVESPPLRERLRCLRMTDAVWRRCVADRSPALGF
jgi:hypothetical protein